MNISFVVNNLGNSELSFDLISLLNKHPENSNAVFYQNIIPPVMETQFLTTNLTALSSATGTVVVFDLDCAQILETSGTPTKNVLYLCDLEWLYKPVNYLVAVELMEKFEVYTHSKKYADIASRYLNKPVKICETLEKLYECLTTK